MFLLCSKLFKGFALPLYLNPNSFSWNTNSQILTPANLFDLIPTISTGILDAFASFWGINAPTMADIKLTMEHHWTQNWAEKYNFVSC